MRFASSFSLLGDTAAAAEGSVATLVEKLGAAPDLLLVYATENHANDALISPMRALVPGTPLR